MWWKKKYQFVFAKLKYLVASGGEWAWIWNAHWASGEEDGPSEKGGVNEIKEGVSWGSERQE